MENTSRRKKCQNKSSPQSKKKDGRNHSQPMSVTPLLIEGGLYCAEQIIAALAISPATLDKWIKANLPVARRNCHRNFFRGRDVMEFLVSPNDKD